VDFAELIDGFSCCGCEDADLTEICFSVETRRRQPFVETSDPILPLVGIVGCVVGLVAELFRLRHLNDCARCRGRCDVHIRC